MVSLIKMGKAVSFVTLVTRHDGNLIRGGAEIQVQETLRGLHENGLRAEILTPLTTELGDLLHFVGPYDYFWETASFALERGVPYVCSSVWYKPGPMWTMHAKRIGHQLTREYLRRVRKLFRNARLIAVPTHDAAMRLTAYYQLDPSKFRIVPSVGISERFAAGDPNLFRKQYSIQEEFVLHVGAFSDRKNQLRLIRALKGTGMRLVCLGRPVDVEYYETCLREGGDGLVVLQPLPNEGPMIPSLLSAARVFCVPSLLDDYLVAGMEAAVAGARLVLSKSWNPQELYGEHARYVDPMSLEDIKQGVQRAWDAPKPGEDQRRWFLERYGREAAMEKLIEIYNEALSA